MVRFAFNEKINEEIVRVLFDFFVLNEKTEKKVLKAAVSVRFRLIRLNGVGRIGLSSAR